MKPNPLLQLQRYGQSVWYDDIDRDLLLSGRLQRMIEEDGVSGVTSNPTIFQKAVASSQAYDTQIRELMANGADVPQIYEALVVADIQTAADVLRPVYERTNGRDGYVSLEVSPHLAHDTEGTIAEARRLFATVTRPNLMIKVPATPAGLPAITTLIGDGLNVNVTLIFSLDVYRRVIESYLDGLEMRLAAGQPLKHVASVASFFVSRIDTVVDRLLQARLDNTADPEQQRELRSLLGKAAVASAKLAYQVYKEAFSQPRFKALEARGARTQRPLWASTSTKNPQYDDILYVQPLIGPDTVNTMPGVTLNAFRDHGIAALTLEKDVDQARQLMEKLAALGVDMEKVTTDLLAAGVKAFADSYDLLLAGIAAKRSALQTG